MTWLGVALAGGVGAAARFLVDHAVTRRLRSNAPWGTWAVNVSGSLAAGLVVGTIAARGLPSDLATVVTGGFLGAYTTFSTAMLQAATQLQQGERPDAILNLVGTLVTCVAAAALGVAITTR